MDQATKRRGLVVMNRGIGDALQQLPAVRAIAGRGGFESLTVLAPPAVVVSRCLYGLDIQLLDLGHGVIQPQSPFDWVIDLASLPWSEEFLGALAYRHHISHDFYSHSTGNGLQNSVIIDGERHPVHFPDMSGLECGQGGDWPAWVLTGQLAALFLNEDLGDWMDNAESNWRDFWGVTMPHAEPTGSMGANRKVLLLPCGATEKRWPEQHWRVLLEALREHGFEPYACLGPLEGEREELMMRRVGYRERVLRLSLEALANEIRGARLTIANDCGPMHLAGVMGAPLLAIFGPTNPICWFPYKGKRQLAVVGGSRMARRAILPYRGWGHPDPTVLSVLRLLQVR